MQVRIEVLFSDRSPHHEGNIRSLALGLTNDRASVRVFTKEADPDWLVAEFTMPNDAQHRAVERIDRSIRFSLGERKDSVICFPKAASKRGRKGKQP